MKAVIGAQRLVTLHPALLARSDPGSRLSDQQSRWPSRSRGARVDKRRKKTATSTSFAGILRSDLVPETSRRSAEDVWARGY